MRLSRTTQAFLNGLLFTSPYIAGLLAFTLYPLGASFYYGFTDYRILTAPRWIGLGNFAQLLSDDLFWISLANTAYYTVLAVPSGLAFSFILALALNLRVRGMPIYRTIFFLPSIVPSVALSILWLWVFNPQYGILNGILGLLGLPGAGWLSDPLWSKPSLILMHLWGVGGTIVIFLAGLQDVPQHLYEAAEIDGARWWHRVRFITIPMVTPVILFNLIIGMINSFQYFTQAYVMTNGGPVNSTLFYALLLYRNAFQYIKMGYASAMAWILFVIVLVCTLFVLWSSRRWVYYSGTK
jgi:multiple sugar transport system permease protein